MGIRVGNVISRNPYKTSVTFSDYGNVIYENGATNNQSNDTKIASTLEFFKMIQESLSSLNITSAITTYSNDSSSNGKHNCICLNFIVDSQEYMITFHTHNETLTFLYTCVRGNASDVNTIRPRTPTTIDSYYDPYLAHNADLAAYIGTLSSSSSYNYVVWSKNIRCNVQTIIYDNVLYLLAKGGTNDPLCVMIGELGNGVGVKNYGAIGFMSSGRADVQPAFATEDVNGWWVSLIDNTPLVNSVSEVVGFPVTFARLGTSSGIDWVGFLPVDSRYMLVTNKYPTNLTTIGTKYGNGTWLSAAIYSSSKCVLIPWDGSSTSVFD